MQYIYPIRLFLTFLQHAVIITGVPSILQTTDNIINWKMQS